MARDLTANIKHRAGGPGGYREVSALAFPVALSMLSQTLMWVVDTSFLGRIGTVEQGAAGFAGNFVWLLLSLFYYGASTGVNICVAQYYGAQTPARCGLVTWQGLYVSLLAWLPLMLCGLYADHLVQFVSPSPALLEPAVTYMRIRLLGALPALLSFTLLGCFRGLGDTLTPLGVTALANALNVLLDYLLIFGHAGFPPLGVAGAAWATVLSTAVGCLLYLTLFLYRGRRQGLLTRWLAPFTWPEAYHLIRISLPVGLQGMLEASAWTLFAVLVARLGVVEAAAHQIALSVLSLAYMLAFGVTIAATTLVGRYRGAGNQTAAWRSARSCLVLTLLVSGAVGGGIFLARHGLVGVFNRDEAVRTLGAHLLMCVAPFQLCQGLALVAAGVLRGAGDTRWPMVAGVVISWGVFLPLAWLAMFPLQAGVAGGWVSAVLYGAILGMTMLRRVLRGGWQDRALA